MKEVQGKRRDGATKLQKIKEEIKQEGNRVADILQRFPWLTESSEGTDFLTRLGDVVTAQSLQGQSLKILAIGALQRQETPKWTKVSRQVRLTGRFSDILRLVENAGNKGILEALKMQRLQPQGGAESPEEIEAQFSLTTVELPPDVRNRLRAASAVLLAGSKPEAAEPGSALLLPVPGRDPFKIPGAPGPTTDPGVSTTTGTTEPPPPEPVLTLTGIITSPGGRVAIINNQMVREGERIDGVLVQAIRKHAVVLKSPSAVKHLTLPEFGSTSQLPGEPSR